MKILFSMRYFYPPVGGGEKSMTSLIEELNKKHEIDVIYSGNENKDFGMYDCILHSRIVKNLFRSRVMSLPFSRVNSFYQMKHWEDILEKEIGEIHPDLVVTQLEFAPPSIKVAHEKNIQSIVFVRGYEHFCPIGFEKGVQDCEWTCWHCVSIWGKIQYPYLMRTLKEHERAIKDASLIVANSRFTASITKKWYDVDAEVVYPFIMVDGYRTNKKEPKFILFSRPCSLKGFDILLKIAEKMKNERFLVVGKCGMSVQFKIKKYDNVEYIPWVDDMREVYSQTKVVIVPSLWPEPFGRVCIEAGINGIPTIASNVGGLPEAVGDGGILIDDIYNINKWIEGIESLEDKTLYKMLSENAKRHAQKFDFENTFKDFKEVVKKKIGVEL